MTPFKIRARLLSFLRDPEHTIDENIDESTKTPAPATTLPASNAEELEEIEQETFSIDEMSIILIEEARNLTHKMSEWDPDEKILDEVLEILPNEKDEYYEGLETAELLMEIQRKFIFERFAGSFTDRLHSFQSDIAALDRDDYLNHYIQVGIMMTQIVQMMVIATQALVAKAYARQATLTSSNEKQIPQTKTQDPDNWMSWGMVTGES